MLVSQKMRALCLLLCLLTLLCACAPKAPAPDTTATPAATATAAPAPTAVPGYEKFTGYFYDALDTVTILTGFAPDKAAFDALLDEAHARFLRFHVVFDRYAVHEGVNGLYSVNKNAGKGPVKAEPELLALLLWLKQNQPLARGTVNVAMGTVLSVWHDYREEGVALPPEKLLQNAALHTNFDDVIINEAEGTVYFADPALTLDLGAVAKGYAVETVSKWLLTTAMPSFIISAGGNVRCGKKPLDGRDRWGVSIQDPDEAQSALSADQGYLDVLYLTGRSVVTSGDYQRNYVVDGVSYHHIIDPATLYPGRYMRAVTVVTEDSALADLLSTAVFLMPYEEGRAFVDGLAGVEAYWVLSGGETRCTDGMRAMLRSGGAGAVDQ